MKVLLIYPEIRRDIPGFSGYYAEGPAILSAVLKTRGHHTELLHITRPMSEARFTSSLMQRDYDVLGFSSLSTGFPEVRRFASWAKAVKRVPAIYGGIHPTLDPEGALSVEGIDMICVGEGEEAFIEVLDRVEHGDHCDGIDNIWTKSQGRINRTPIRPLIEDLDSLPLPDYDLFTIPRLFGTKEGVALIPASRGCPFHCSYCSNHKIRGLYPNSERYVRSKSVDRTIQEAKTVLALSSRLRYIDYADDIFILNKQWLEEFAFKFPREVGVPFSCNAMVRVVDDERARLLRQAGCTLVTVGLESGSERLRRDILKRPTMTNQMILNAAAILRRHGIRMATFNMVGLPTETVHDVFETIRLNAALRPTKANQTIFQPYPNTELFAMCIRMGILDAESSLPNNWRAGTILHQQCFPSYQVMFFEEYFKILVRLLSFVQRHMPGAEQSVIGFIKGSILGNRFIAVTLSGLHRTLFTSIKLLYVKILYGLVNRRAREFKQSRRTAASESEDEVVEIRR